MLNNLHIDCRPDMTYDTNVDTIVTSDSDDAFNVVWKLHIVSKNTKWLIEQFVLHLARLCLLNSTRNVPWNVLLCWTSALIQQSKDIPCTWSPIRTNTHVFLVSLPSITHRRGQWPPRSPRKTGQPTDHTVEAQGSDCQSRWIQHDWNCVRRASRLIGF